MNLKDINNKRREELKNYFSNKAKNMNNTGKYLIVLNDKNELVSSEKAQKLISKIGVKTLKANNVKDELGLLFYISYCSKNFKNIKTCKFYTPVVYGK